MLVLKIMKSIIIDSNHKKTYLSHWLTYQQEYPMELLYTTEQVNQIYKCIPTWPAIFEVKNNWKKKKEREKKRHNALGTALDMLHDPDTIINTPF